MKFVKAIVLASTLLAVGGLNAWAQSGSSQQRGTGTPAPGSGNISAATHCLDFGRGCPLEERSARKRHRLGPDQWHRSQHWNSTSECSERQRAGRQRPEWLAEVLMQSQA